MIKHASLFAVILCFATQGVFGQNKGFMGREFWATFTENIVKPEDTALHVVLVSSTDDTIQMRHIGTGSVKIYVTKANVPRRAYFNRVLWLNQLSAGAQPTGV